MSIRFTAKFLAMPRKVISEEQKEWIIECFLSLPDNTLPNISKITEHTQYQVGKIIDEYLSKK